jgi:2-methylcitrate dehydratase PrpD
MLAGSHNIVTRSVARSIRGWGEGRATLVGRAESAAAPWAALVNGTAAHALDFDDYDPAAIAHASAVIVPALLAVAEARNLSGHALLDAYIVGFEILARVGQAVNPGHYARGWHATSTIGTLAAAVACGRLLRLDAGTMEHALGLGTSMAAGSRSQLGTMAKPVHAGLAAKAGVLAAELAANGITAATDSIGGPRGFGEMFSDSGIERFDSALAKLGTTRALEEVGLVVKRFPSCGSTLRSIDGVLELRTKYGFSPAEVDSISTAVPEQNARNLMYSAPRNAMEARFSMQYCLAVALLHGELSLADFTPEAIGRPEVRAWLPRIKMHAYPAPSEGENLADRQPAVTTIHLMDGHSLVASVRYAKGTLANPLTAAELSAKFRTCGASCLDASALTAGEAALENIDSAAGVRDVMQYLAGNRSVVAEREFASA